jgi:hypothetical protein
MLRYMRGQAILYFRYLIFLTESQFWPMWCCLTAGCLAGAAWLLRDAAREGRHPRVSRSKRSRADVGALAALALFLCGYLAVVLVWEDFAFPDDSQLTTVTLRGHDYGVQIHPTSGRFVPLALQEFKVIRHLTHTLWGYHVFPAFELLILALALVLVDDDLSTGQRVSLTVIALLTPSAVVSLTGLIYPERNVFVLLACFAVFVRRFEESRWPLWGIAAVMSSQVMLYLKEPVFLLLLSFAAVRLMLRRRMTGDFGGPEDRLDLCIAAVSLVYSGWYGILVFPKNQALYLMANRVSPMESIRFYIHADPLAWLFAGILAVRLVLILRDRAAPVLLWDGLACGAAVYFVAYLTMRLTTYYYLAPVDIVAVLYLGRLLILGWAKMPRAVRAGAAAVAALLVCRNLELSAWRTLHRKYFIQQTAATADAVLDAWRRDPAQVRSLYFPYSPPYSAAEFAAYASYRGLPVEEAGVRTARDGAVQLIGGKFARDGACVVYLKFMCHPGAAPSSGSMTIVLADEAPLDRLNHNREAHVPATLTWGLRWVDRLHYGN